MKNKHSSTIGEKTSKSIGVQAGEALRLLYEVPTGKTFYPSLQSIRVSTGGALTAKMLQDACDAATRRCANDLNKEFFNVATNGLVPENAVTIKQVQNGFIVTVDYQTYVFTDFRSASKFMNVYFKDKVTSALEIEA